MRAGLVGRAVCARRPMTAMSSRANPAVAVSRSSANTGMFVTVPSSRCGSNSHSPSHADDHQHSRSGRRSTRQLEPRHHDELPSTPASVAGPSTVGTRAPRVVSTDAGLWVPRTADPERCASSAMWMCGSRAVTTVERMPRARLQLLVDVVVVLTLAVTAVVQLWVSPPAGLVGGTASSHGPGCGVHPSAASSAAGSRWPSS